MRLYVRKRLDAADVEDVVQNSLLAALYAVTRNDFDPKCFFGYVWTIVKRETLRGCGTRSERKRQADLDVNSSLISTSEPDPETNAYRREQLQIASGLLRRLPTRQKEILRRFYFEDQSEEQICEEMGLTYNQFRLAKSRSRARLRQMYEAAEVPRRPMGAATASKFEFVVSATDTELQKIWA